MKMNLKKIYRLIIIYSFLVSTMFYSGCLIAAGTVGAVWYLSTLRGTLYCTLENAENAAKTALKTYDIVIYSSTYSDKKNSWTITWETYNGNSVNIDLNKKEAEETKVSIKIGEWGDKSLSRHILNAMQNELDNES